MEDLDAAIQQHLESIRFTPGDHPERAVSGLDIEVDIKEKEQRQI